MQTGLTIYWIDYLEGKVKHLEPQIKALQGELDRTKHAQAEPSSFGVITELLARVERIESCLDPIEATYRYEETCRMERN